MSHAEGPWDLVSVGAAWVLSGLTNLVPRRVRTFVGRHRGWVLVILAATALAMVVVGIMNPVPRPE